MLRLARVLTLFLAAFFATLAVGDFSDPCRTVFYWFGTLNESYRVRATVPMVPLEEPVRVLVYAPKDTVEDFQQMLAQMAGERAHAGRGKMTFLVVSAESIAKGDLLGDVQRVAKDYDVVVMHGHSSPSANWPSHEHAVRAEDVRELDLSGKTLVLSGCATGSCYWPPYMQNQDLVWTPVPHDRRNLDAAMTHTGARYALGTLHESGLSVTKAALRAMLAGDREESVDGVKALERPTAARPRLGDEFGDLDWLKRGTADERVRYIQAMPRWRKQFEGGGFPRGYPDVTFETQLASWVRDEKAAASVKRAAMDFFLAHEPKKIEGLIGNLSAKERSRLVDSWVADPECRARILAGPHYYFEFARGNDADLAKLAKLLPAAQRGKILKDLKDDPYSGAKFNWLLVNRDYEPWSLTAVRLIKILEKLPE